METNPIFYKACGRCNGDMVYDSDRFGRYLECIQCGNHVYPDYEIPDIGFQEPTLGQDGIE